MFRFTIRDVLWLTVVVGMGSGWFVHIRSERAARQKERQEVFKKALDQTQEMLDRVSALQKASRDEN